jgi:hypothetical protein
MGLTDQVGERVLFTNCDDLPEVTDVRSGFFCIRGTDLDRLTKDDLKAISDWLHGAVVTRKHKSPLPHQAEALGAILTGLDDNDRLTAVMACGTGKTLVSLWLAERIPGGGVKDVNKQTLAYCYGRAKSPNDAGMAKALTMDEARPMTVLVTLRQHHHIRQAFAPYDSSPRSTGLLDRNAPKSTVKIDAIMPYPAAPAQSAAV